MRSLVLMLLIAGAALADKPPQAPLPPQAPMMCVVTETRTIAPQPKLRAAIAQYARESPGRAWIEGEDTEKLLMRSWSYTAADLDGLTEDELRLLHGWNLRFVERRAPPVQEIFPQPTFRGGVRGGC